MSIKIGLVSISDRASQGIYEDKGIPALLDWLSLAIATPFSTETRGGRVSNRFWTPKLTREPLSQGNFATQSVWEFRSMKTFRLTVA